MSDENSSINFDENKLNYLNWSVKSILASNLNDNNSVDKYCDISFNLSNMNHEKNVNMCLFNNDVKSIYNELNKIKENLNTINNLNN